MTYFSFWKIQRFVTLLITPHTCDTNLDELLMCLEHDTALTVCWFESNYMKLNTGKCHIIISGNKHESLWADIGNKKRGVELLGVNINVDLKFNKHMMRFNGH